MKEFNSIIEIANFFNMKIYDVVENYEDKLCRGTLFVGENKIKIESLNHELKYVYVDENDNKDCEEYLMKYDIGKYDWKVYVDDLEGWQNCKVLNIKNKGLDIIRATVETECGTKVDRLVKYALDKDELVANRCVFMIEKEEKEKEYDENEFYSTKNKILLATNNRGGYFLDPKTNKVENIVYKGSGYGNCIIGTLDYMKNLIKQQEIKGTKVDYEYTKEGKQLLGIDERKKSLSEQIKEAKSVCSNDKDIKNNKSVEFER